MKTLCVSFLLLAAVLVSPNEGTAGPILMFEGYAPEGGSKDLYPLYMEQGFTLTPSRDLTARVIDSTESPNLDYLTFDDQVTITLTGPSTTFDLGSLLLRVSS